MFRHEPAVLLYAPLHVVIWGDPAGPSYLTCDRPSGQFGSREHRMAPRPLI